MYIYTIRASNNNKLTNQPLHVQITCLLLNNYIQVYTTCRLYSYTISTVVLLFSACLHFFILASTNLLPSWHLSNIISNYKSLYQGKKYTTHLTYNIPPPTKENPTKALSFVNFKKFTTWHMAIFLIYLILHEQIMQYG